MATVSTPVLTYTAALAGSSVGQSSSTTYSINITGGWEVQVPIQVLQPNSSISAGPEFYAYRSSDGGVTYSTVPVAAGGIVRSPNTTGVFSLRLETGIYAIQCLSGGGAAQTWSFSILTQSIITAILQQ